MIPRDAAADIRRGVALALCAVAMFTAMIAVVKDLLIYGTVVAVIVVVEKVSTLELLYPSPNTTISGEKSRTICKFG